MAKSIKLGSDIFLDPSGVGTSQYNLGNNNYISRSTDLDETLFSTRILYYARFGMMKGIYLNVNPTSSFSFDVEILIATIPELYLPAVDCNFTIAGQSKDSSALLEVRRNGDLNLYLPSGVTRSFIRGWFWYI